MFALLAGAVAAPGPSVAARPEVRWNVTRGALQPGMVAGSFILATDATVGRFSLGEVTAREPVSLPFRLEVTVRRLGPEAGRSLHVGVVGGNVLIKAGAVALYGFGDTMANLGGWSKVAGLRTSDEHRYTVTQDARSIELSIDGAPVRRFEVAAARSRGNVGFGFKGATGFRSLLYVRSAALQELAAAP